MKWPRTVTHYHLSTSSNQAIKQSSNHEQRNKRTNERTNIVTLSVPHCYVDACRRRRVLVSPTGTPDQPSLSTSRSSRATHRRRSSSFADFATRSATPGRSREASSTRMKHSIPPHIVNSSRKRASTSRRRYPPPPPPPPPAPARAPARRPLLRFPCTKWGPSGTQAAIPAGGLSRSPTWRWWTTRGPWRGRTTPLRRNGGR